MSHLNRQGRSRLLAQTLASLEARGLADEVAVIRYALVELKRENGRRRDIAKGLADALSAAQSALDSRAGTT